MYRQTTAQPLPPAPSRSDVQAAFFSDVEMCPERSASQKWEVDQKCRDCNALETFVAADMSEERSACDQQCLLTVDQALSAAVTADGGVKRWGWDACGIRKPHMANRGPRKTFMYVHEVISRRLSTIAILLG